MLKKSLENKCRAIGWRLLDGSEITFQLPGTKRAEPVFYLRSDTTRRGPNQRNTQVRDRYWKTPSLLWMIGLGSDDSLMKNL